MIPLHVLLPKVLTKTTSDTLLLDSVNYMIVHNSTFYFLPQVNPCKHPIVILKDIGHQELAYMLDFMYKGEVGVKHEELPSFLKLAEMLKVKGLAGEVLEVSVLSILNLLKMYITHVIFRKILSVYLLFMLNFHFQKDVSPAPKKRSSITRVRKKKQVSGSGSESDTADKDSASGKSKDERQTRQRKRRYAAVLFVHMHLVTD